MITYTCRCLVVCSYLPVFWLHFTLCFKMFVFILASSKIVEIVQVPTIFIFSDINNFYCFKTFVLLSLLKLFVSRQFFFLFLLFYIFF